MPTQSRGFFACDYCGLQHDTLEEATEHESSQCPRAQARRQISYLPFQQQQQQILPQRHQNFFLQQGQIHQHHDQQQPNHQAFTTMGPAATIAMEGIEAYPQYTQFANYPGHKGIFPLSGIDSYQKSATIGASMSMTPPRCFRIVDFPPDQSANHLSVSDRLACQNMEIFEASQDFILECKRAGGIRHESRIALKQIGLRCRNCGYGSNNNNNTNKHMTTEQFSFDFSTDLASVGDSVRNITDRHLISCKMTDHEVREACQRAASKRKQRKRGPGVTPDDRNIKEDNDNDERNRSALVNYCIDFCQQKGIANKASQHGNKMGIEFITTTRDSAQAVETSDFGVAMGGDLGGGSGLSYPAPHLEQHQLYDSSNLPFYQESDKTWHCKFCSYVPHQFRDSQSIWSSPGGGAPPNSFIGQHLSVCRVYQQQQQQQNFTLHPTSISPPAPATALMPFNTTPSYSSHPVSYGIQPHGQPPTSLWETTSSIGGSGQQHPHNLQYMPPHQESNYPYGHSQYPPPGTTTLSHTKESSSVGARFLEHRGLSNAYSDERPRCIRGGKKSGVRSSALKSEIGPRTIFGGENSTDNMNNAMDFLAHYDREYYERDPAHAAIPKLVLDEDHLLLTDYFFYLMKQLRLCRFTESDRKTRGGKREKIKIGYGGLQCIHCSDLPMSRKFFWSNVDRLANSFAEIPGHVLKCRRCPQRNKDALMRLKQGHAEQMSKLPRGSQKIFFRRMWRRLHDGDPQDEEVAPIVQVQVDPPKADIALESRSRPPLTAIATSPEKGLDDLSQSGSHSGSITVLSDETILVMQRSAKEAAKALMLSSTSSGGPSSPSSRILVAIPEDKEWLSDIDAYVRKQLEVFCATEDDVAAAQSDRKYSITVGQVGIRCIHCSIAQGCDAIGHATAYPFSINAIYESVKEFHRLHLDSCSNLPATTKSKLNSMKGASSLSSLLRKYYTLAAKALGLRDTKNGIRTGGESNPIGSLAAFTFAEAEETNLTKNDEGNKEDKQLSADDRGEISFAPSNDSSRGTKRSGSPSVTLLGSQSKPKSAKWGI